MKIQHSNNENNFKKNLKHLNIEVNTDEIWIDIQDKLPKKKRKYGILWLFVATVLIVGSIFTKIYYDIRPTQNKINKNTTITKKTNPFPNYNITGTTSQNSKLLNNKIRIQKDIIQSKSMVSKTKKEVISKQKAISVQTNYYLKLQIKPPSLLQLKNKKFDLKFTASKTKLDDKDYFFEFQTGIHTTYLQKKLKASSNIQMSKEVGKIGYSSQLFYGKNLKNNWHLVAGVSYLKITTNHKYNYQKIFHEMTFEDSIVTILPNGTLNNQKGYLTKTNIQDRIKSLFRHQEFIGLNIGLGKSFFTKKRVNISLRQTVQINYLTKTKGYYFAEKNNQEVIANEKSLNPFKKWGYINTSFNATAYYHISTNFKTGLGIQFTHDINSLTINSNYYDIKNLQLGVNFFIQYKPFN